VAEWLKAAVCKTALYEFVGSNPTPSTIQSCAQVAQSVEQEPEELRVGGSIPSLATYAAVAELVDAPHSKCGVSQGVPVRVRPAAPTQPA
jgi:hypothetical protein